MLFALIALFIIGPIAEIFVLLKAAEIFSIWAVIAACLITAFLGGILIRMQGLAAINNARGDLQSGKMPVDAAVDGALLVVAAPFLMTPGFLTDLIGFSLLIPAVRRALAREALKRLRARIVTTETYHGPPQ